MPAPRNTVSSKNAPLSATKKGSLKALTKGPPHSCPSVSSEVFLPVQPVRCASRSS